MICLTLGLAQASWRYTVIEKNVLRNLDFSQGGKFWASNGRGVQLYPGTPPVLVLNAQSNARNVIMSRLLPHATNKFQGVRISADMSSHNLSAGPAPWQRGRIILLSLDAQGKRIWYWPQEVAAVHGTRSWKHYQGVIPLNPLAVQTWLIVYIASPSGKLLVKNLNMEGVAPSDLYQMAFIGLLGFWLITGIWILFCLFPPARHNMLVVVALTYGLGLFAGGLTPQPLLRDSLDLARQGAHQLIADISKQTAIKSQEPKARKHEQAPQIESSKNEKKVTPKKSTAQGKSQATTSVTTRNSHLPRQLRTAGSDKRLHVIAFAGLGLLVLLAFNKYHFHRGVLMAFLLGAAIESLQSLSITREPEWLDLGYNTAGIISGALLALGILALFNKRQVKPHL